MAQRVTMGEIARQSGVSLATVSLVLRDRPGVNDETRHRVLEMAKDLGYQRRSANEQPNSAPLRQVGVLIKARADEAPDANPFYGPILAGIEALCNKQQINLLYSTLPVDSDNRPLALPRMLNDDQVDGLLLVGALVEGGVAMLLRRQHIPTVLVDAYATDGAYDAVLTDNVRGSYEMMQYLMAQGHRHIALVGSMPNGYPSIRERRYGYLQALSSQGINDHYFFDSQIYPPDETPQLIEMLKRHPQISALFCINDRWAIHAIRTLRQHDYRIPEQIAIVGFDNIELTEHLTPALTTMHVDKIGMGRIALQLLSNRLDYPEGSPISALVRPSLVIRQSVLPRTL